MQKHRLILILALMIFLVSGWTVFTGAEDGELIGSLTIDMSDPVRRMDSDFIPVNRIAEHINYELDWELKDDQVEGYLGDLFFSADDYFIHQDRLYLPVDLFTPEFGLNIEQRGNRYFIFAYQKQRRVAEIKVDLKTNTDTVARDEPLAVSVLLLNNTGELVEVNFRSGLKYDLVLTRFGREQWRLSDGRAYTQAIISEELEDRDYLLFTNLIQPELRRGQYELTAEINTTDEIRKSEPITITIQ